ncbi:competence protein ComFA [Bacillus mesophilus]|uniref:DEAD/DEAH box helicase n=1 Tax=Bacillus mesophilus TaxID=1808955 RepID=A0A6M0Q7H7_9BACI|nr:DEAD/DEAH box helicase [Bacillus mesophilus]MBM7661598.1 competence protein ComFA [Bacillus mesophilus]NEY72267.1 DEAD/DEAH box helicase [Bacillus mesophilus]
MLFSQDDKMLKPSEHGSRISDLYLEAITLDPTFNFSVDLQQTLQGRRLLIDEIPFPLEVLQEHYEHGYIQYHYGVKRIKGLYECVRCGNQEDALFARFGCARCKKTCTYCRKCIAMGRVSECTPLVSWGGSVETFQYETPLVWDGVVSKGQANASSELVSVITKDSELLIWAVCGAGKTEVLFEGISLALSLGKYVCLATPRTDVVIELAPRIKSVFPDVIVHSLYGGSSDPRCLAPITIATTHQLLRYYKAFDVIIIDEVDAFPYSFDAMLQRAVQQAKKETSSTIYLTATPDSKWKKKVYQNQIESVTIPARFHGHPLPVPEYRWCGNWRKYILKRKIPSVIMVWLQEKLESKRQAFLFVPSIEVLEDLLPLVREISEAIEGVHSKDPLRKEKVASFRAGVIPILLTTTILERGVTIPKTDVGVLGADDGVFTESTLVQIAGRVGRSTADPTGEILYFHFGKTGAMVSAKKQIMSMNKQAVEKGLLK